jgi:hypothetical protein
MAQPVKNIQFAYEIGGVLGPKDDTIDRIRTQRNPADLLRIKRVPHQDKTFFDPVHEPVAVIGGYVGPSAGRDDHNRTLPQCITALIPFTTVFRSCRTVSV